MLSWHYALAFLPVGVLEGLRLGNICGRDCSPSYKDDRRNPKFSESNLDTYQGRPGMLAWWRGLLRVSILQWIKAQMNLPSKWSLQNTVYFYVGIVMYYVFKLGEDLGGYLHITCVYRTGSTEGTQNWGQSCYLTDVAQSSCVTMAFEPLCTRTVRWAHVWQDYSRPILLQNSFFCLINRRLCQGERTVTV